MSPYPRAVVSPSPDGTPFWEAADRGQLVLPFCAPCDRYFFYPRTTCPRCGSRDVGWRPASGRGRVHSFCIHHSTAVPELRDALPFVTALVTLDEGPRLMSFLVDVAADPAAIHCEMTVEVAFIPGADGRTVPAFRPAVAIPAATPAAG